MSAIVSSSAAAWSSGSLTSSLAFEAQRGEIGTEHRERLVHHEARPVPGAVRDQLAAPDADEEIVILVVDRFHVGAFCAARHELAPCRPQSVGGGRIDACEQIEDFLAGRAGEQRTEQAVGIGPHRVLIRWRSATRRLQCPFRT